MPETFLQMMYRRGFRAYERGKPLAHWAERPWIQGWRDAEHLSLSDEPNADVVYRASLIDEKSFADRMRSRAKRIALTRAKKQENQ